MSRIDFLTDQEILRRVRSEQSDPIVMSIVVPYRTTAGLSQLALDLIRTIRIADDQFKGATELNDEYHQWLEASFRKIVLRAKPAKYDAVMSLGAVRGDNCLILPPQRRSKRPPLLSKLQTLKMGMDSDSQGLERLSAPQSGQCLVRESLEMSAGKILAQIGHAALMMPEVEIDSVLTSDDESWEEVAKEFTVGCVTDAGLTEVSAGSETIMFVVAK